MTAIWIIFGVLLLFLFLLLCPVVVYVDYDAEPTVKVRFLLVKVTLYPRPEKEKPAGQEKTEDRKKNEENPAKSKIKGILEQKGLSGFLEILREFASATSDTAKKGISHLVIDRLFLDLTVSDPDAAQTAILYGEVCAAVYTPMGILLNKLKCRQYHLNIVPDFQKKKCEIRFSLKAHILLLFLVTAALKAPLQSLKIFKKIKQSPEN